MASRAAAKKDECDLTIKNLATSNSSPRVAIVNEQFAKKFNLGRDAVGKRMWAPGLSPGTDLNIEIVGLVPNLKYSEVKREIPPVFYYPHGQRPGMGFLNFYVRTSIDPNQFLATIQPTIARLDPN